MNRILIVDDDQDVCTVLKKVLEHSGLKADYYEDPVSALKIFKPDLYDLLLLDVKMPEMNGFELYKEMKKIDNNVKVCFLTASELYYEEFREGGEFSALDKDLFLRKPIKNEELIKEIKRKMESD
jgi:DNA-binding response OmpR family regulator